MAFGQAWNMSTFAPKAQLTAIENDWGVYYVDRIQKMLDGEWESADTWWGFKEGMLQMSPFSRKVTPRQAAAADATKAGIIDGSAPVFAGPIKDRDGKEQVAAGADARRRRPLEDGLVRRRRSGLTRSRATPALTLGLRQRLTPEDIVRSESNGLIVCRTRATPCAEENDMPEKILRGRVLRFLTEPRGHRRHRRPMPTTRTARS